MKTFLFLQLIVIQYHQLKSVRIPLDENQLNLIKFINAIKINR